MNHSFFPEASESTSRTLLERVQQQDPAAWERFVKLYGPIVYRWCQMPGLQVQDADDVGQEVLRAVHQGIARFRRQTDGPSLRAWLYAITRNKIRDHFRRLQDEPAAFGGSAAYERLAHVAQLPENDPEPAEGYVAELSHRALNLIQTEFERTTWQAFWMLAVDGLSGAEVSMRLGLSKAAAFKAKSRVLKRLRCELEDLLD